MSAVINDASLKAMSAQLAQGCDALGLTVTPDQQQAMLSFLCLLAKWNNAYNLTSKLAPLACVSRHLLDSLAIAPLLKVLKGQRFIDIGSGAGFPSVPLALLYPQCQWVLLDANGKKTRFLQQVSIELAIKNIEIVQMRAENYQDRSGFDGILSRAFASMPLMLQRTKQLSAANGFFWAMKGAYPQQELDQILPGFTVVAVTPLAVPFLNAERHLVQISLDKHLTGVPF